MKNFKKLSAILIIACGLSVFACSGYDEASSAQNIVLPFNQNNQTSTSSDSTTYATIISDLKKGAQTLGDYAMVFALAYGPAIMHELGHAIVWRYLTGVWPKICIGESANSDYVVIDNSKFKLDISGCFPKQSDGGYAYCETVHPAPLVNLMESVFEAKISANGGNMLNQDQMQDVILDAENNFFGRTSCLIFAIAGPLGGMLGALALKNHFSDHIFPQLARFIAFSVNYFSLNPTKQGSDGYRACYAIGIQSKYASLAFGALANLTVALFLSMSTNGRDFLQRTLTEFDIKDLIKYWALHHTIVNRNGIERLKAFTILAALVAFDYFNLIQQAADYIKNQKIGWLDRLQENGQELSTYFFPDWWHIVPDITKSTVNWSATIGIIFFCTWFFQKLQPTPR